MKTLSCLLIPVFFLLFSCKEKEEPMGEEEIFWVYSYPVVSRPGSMPVVSGFAISREEEFNFDSSTWELIPMDIEGFTFKPYFFQKLSVYKTNDPTTGDSKRKLIQVLAEESDYFQLLEGGWKLKKYLGLDVPNKDFPNGQIMVIFSIPRIAASSDGCNQIQLEIQKVGPDKILSFGLATTTAIACPDGLRINAFPGLEKNFKREGNILTFYSDEEGEVAVWEKIN